MNPLWNARRRPAEPTVLLALTQLLSNSVILPSPADNKPGATAVDLPESPDIFENTFALRNFHEILDRLSKANRYCSISTDPRVKHLTEEET